MNVQLNLDRIILIVDYFLIFYIAVISFVIDGCYRSNSNQPNACLKKNCHLGAQCLLSFDGRTAECVCMEKCPSYGDSQGSRLICGSDGNDYPNLCELNRYSCEVAKEFYVRYNGSCDPCYGIKCPASQVCQIDDNRNPICKCNAACGQEFEPVCGSDGKTYINECTLRVEACRNRKSLRILHQKSCAENNACKVLKCSHYQECEINRYGIATCLCPQQCSKILKPVCGTDGETYDSECDLKRLACLEHRNVSIRYMGSCENFCHRNHGICKFGSICGLSRDGNYTCLCPQCSEEYEPICGSNGVTYKNVCKFRKDMCEKQINNITFSDGPCIGCENLNCQFYAKCETHENKGLCVCPKNCPKTFDPVCGSDLKTYPNECELRVSSCQKKKHIIVIKQGPCNSCQNVHCQFGSRCENGVCVCPKKCPSYIAPVCGSNNVTYENHCQLMVSACSRSKKIAVQYKGHCESLTQPRIKFSETIVKPCTYNTCRYGGLCAIDTQSNQQHCLCSFNCSNISIFVEKICGSDGRIYDNECVFREEICIRQQEIRKMEMIFCKKFLNIPCHGEPPLINSVTKKEYDCHQQSCPKDSYCHRGADFAKCCQELDFEEDCSDTVFGCCPDDKTPALGPNYGGCPNVCQCNRLGSYLTKCDPKTKQCYCKPGVGGLRCDRCEAGYWGLHKINEGNAGCIPCKCVKMGSSRTDCEQMTGRCVCKQGFQGMKCDICSDKNADETEKCPVNNATTVTNQQAISNSCQDSEQCRFGSVCIDSKCVCDFKCPYSDQIVCGSDGQIHESRCHMEFESCKSSKEIVVLPKSQCSTTTIFDNHFSIDDSDDTATTSPVRRSTYYLDYERSKQSIVPDRSNLNSEGILLNTSPTIPTINGDDNDGRDDDLTLLDSGSRSAHFNGNSLIEMETLKAHEKIYISLEMIPFSSDGIILYNGQTNTGEGDYIALMIKNSIIEFKFNLGSGSVILKGPRPVKLGSKISIEINRRFSQASLTINNEQIIGENRGPHRLLDLGSNFYLGGLPSSNFKIINDVLQVKKNFTGCIHSMIINQERIFPFNNFFKQSLINVDNCDKKACAKSFCHNNGYCEHLKDIENQIDSIHCVCSRKYQGDRCESKICTGHRCTFCQYDPNLCNQSVMDFWNQSFIQLPTLQGISHQFNIEVWLMARSPDGLILFNGYTEGDFLQLKLEQGFIKFDFNLGSPQNKSSSVSISSLERISLGEWHRIVMIRQSKIGILQINDLPSIKDTAKGNLNELNLNQPLYLGGLPESEPNQFFNGAIQRITINGIILKNLIDKAQDLVDVQPYQGPPCGLNNPCHNNGKCSPWLNTPICQCGRFFHGEFCEKHYKSDSKIVPLKTDDLNEIVIDLLTANYQQNFIELKLRTRRKNGLVFWLGNDPHKNEFQMDYIALIVIDGFLEFSFNLGKQSNHLSIRGPIRISDGEIHRVLLMRNKRIGIIEIDERHMSSGVSEEGATELNTNGKLHLGGSGTQSLPKSLPKSYHQKFIGCIELLRVEANLLISNKNNLFGCQEI